MSIVEDFKYFWKEDPRGRWMLFILFAAGAFFHTLYIIYEFLFRSEAKK